MNFLQRLISPLLGRGRARTPTPISEMEFTEAFAHILRGKLSDMEIAVAGPLELKLCKNGGNGQSAFLENAFTEYRRNPTLRDEVLEKFAVAFCDTTAMRPGTVDRSRIVPVIKDAAYLRDVRAALAERGHDVEDFSQVFEPYNPELVVLYAEDSPRNMRYLTQKDLDELGLSMSDLREMAIENLRRILPDIALAGDNGIYMVSAGGDYEASLLLVDSIWLNGKIKVEGEIVVAIPVRGVLVITGSQNRIGLKSVRELALRMAAEEAYRLTPRLFVYRNGQFEVFEES